MKKIPLSHLISIIIIGISFGWLIGMTTSPVMQIVVTSLVALVVSLVTILSGLEKKEDKEGEEMGSEKKKRANQFLNRSINPIPIMLMMIGIVLGSMTGVWTRTHEWLGGPDAVPKTLKQQVDEWESAGMNREDAVYGLFTRETGISMSLNDENPTSGNEINPTQEGTLDTISTIPSHSTNKKFNTTTPVVANSSANDDSQSKGTMFNLKHKSRIKSYQAPVTNTSNEIDPHAGRKY
jgi:hypothetical protein